MGLRICDGSKLPFKFVKIEKERKWIKENLRWKGTLWFRAVLCEMIGIATVVACF